MLEELLAAGHAGAEYDAWLIRINEGDQFGSGFVGVNPNSKIPALMDRSGSEPVRVFESGAILLYLAEKFGAFLPRDGKTRTEALCWLFWQMGSGPYLGGGFGHFYAYAPTKIEYAIDRFAMEAKRQLDVLDKRLAEVEYLGGSDYTIADMAGVALVRRPDAGQHVRRFRHLPPGRRLQEPEALDRGHRGAAGGEARPHGQPGHGRAVEPTARAPRRGGLRHQDAGQGGRRGRGEIADGAGRATLFPTGTVPRPAEIVTPHSPRAAAFDATSLRRTRRVSTASGALPVAAQISSRSPRHGEARLQLGVVAGRPLRRRGVRVRAPKAPRRRGRRQSRA